MVLVVTASAAEGRVRGATAKRSGVAVAGGGGAPLAARRWRTRGLDVERRRLVTAGRLLLQRP